MSEQEQDQAQVELKQMLNRLANRFYEAHGCEADEGFDFSASRHPQERLMYWLAREAYEFFLDEGEL